ncbi:MAG: FeoA domain-containing protein [Bryobacteraceae bacterium]|nr:FeoA domain-containing protein [Bryobacteraceae bacterium]
MQVSFKKAETVQTAPLAELAPGECGIIASLDLPEELAQRLMELGFLPGHAVERSASAPGGDPVIFCVDGSQVALRGDLCRRIRFTR